MKRLLIRDTDLITQYISNISKEHVNEKIKKQILEKLKVFKYFIGSGDHAVFINDEDEIFITSESQQGKEYKKLLFYLSDLKEDDPEYNEKYVMEL